MKRQSKRRTSVLRINITQTRHKVIPKRQSDSDLSAKPIILLAMSAGVPNTMHGEDPNRMRDDRVLQALADKLLKKQKVSATNWRLFSQKIPPVTPPRCLNKKSSHDEGTRHQSHLEIDFETAMQAVHGFWSLAAFYLRNLQRWRQKPGSEPALCPKCRQRRDQCSARTFSG